MKTKKPTIIYQTNEDWGDTWFADELRMLEMIEELKKGNPDFADISLDDCDYWLQEGPSYTKELHVTADGTYDSVNYKCDFVPSSETGYYEQENLDW